MSKIELTQEAGGSLLASLTVDTRITSVTAINRAIYWLADEVALQITSVSPAAAPLVELTFEVPSELERSSVACRILRVLNDFSVRERIEEQTCSIRQEILTTALSALRRA